MSKKSNCNVSNFKFIYIPELICISLFIFFSMCWSYTAHQYEELNVHLDELTLLEAVSRQHKIQLLSANLNDQLHYDHFSQLQSQIETIISNNAINSELQQLLHKYTEKSLCYMQLVTMIKTSQRLLSKKTQAKENKINPIYNSAKQSDSPQQYFRDIEASNILNNMKASLFNFITSPNKPNKLIAYNLALTIEDELKGQDQYLHLFKLHTLFILDNYEKAAAYRKQLMSMPVLDQTLTSIAMQHHKIQSIQYQRYISAFCSFISILLIFFIILKRQQYALTQTSQAYKQAAEVKTQFLANMSHEIRTPMTGIIGLLDLCLKSPLTDELQSYLEKAKFSANSLLTIINDILDFSKIESGQLTIENVPFEHYKLLDSLNMMLGKIAEEKGIELIFDIDPEIPPVLVGDSVRVAQILLNLLSNAIKFTSDGHVILRSTLIRNNVDKVNEGNEDTQSYINNDDSSLQCRSFNIRYEIEDTGIGLSLAQQTKLFKRFSQADESTTRKYGGTGLGLAISKLLVEIMEGEISAESKEGKGSTFSLILPLIEEDSAKLAQSITKPIPTKKYNGLRVLLLEDNDITQWVISKMANYCEVDIDVASTVNKAKLLCKNQSYDIALIDWRLQGETGVDFISDIHQESYCPQFMTICSAYSKAYIEENSALTLDVHYLAKPLTFISFIDMLNIYSNFNENNPKASLLDKNINTRVEEKVNVIVENKKNIQLVSNKNKNKNNKILLVEDNKINQLVATKLLESLGLNVDVREDGYQALECIAENNYSVVLMDIQMPKLDGVATTIELRKRYTEEQLKIIALTANVTAEEVEYYNDIGMNGHLGKPYDIVKIIDLLTNYYDLHLPET